MVLALLVQAFPELLQIETSRNEETLVSAAVLANNIDLARELLLRGAKLGINPLKMSMPMYRNILAETLAFYFDHEMGTSVINIKGYIRSGNTGIINTVYARFPDRLYDAAKEYALECMELSSEIELDRRAFTLYMQQIGTMLRSLETPATSCSTRFGDFLFFCCPPTSKRKRAEEVLTAHFKKPGKKSIIERLLHAQIDYPEIHTESAIGALRDHHKILLNITAVFNRYPDITPRSMHLVGHFQPVPETKEMTELTVPLLRTAP
jgi:hypothetical protein